MKQSHVPRVDARYWAAIAVASVFGTNLGDLYADKSGLGTGLGLAVLAAVAAAGFLLERRDPRRHEGWYWFVIVVIRTGATNIADLLAFRVRVPAMALGAGLVALLALLGWQTQRRSGRAGESRGTRLPDADAVYWAAMLTAGVLGTVLGDDCSGLLGEGVASLLLAGTLLAVLVATRARARSAMRYWAIVGLARTAGTAIGDWLAENRMLNIGLPLSTLLSGLTFLAVVLLWRSGREEAVR